MQTGPANPSSVPLITGQKSGIPHRRRSSSLFSSLNASGVSIWRERRIAHELTYQKGTLTDREGKSVASHSALHNGMTMLTGCLRTGLQGVSWSSAKMQTLRRRWTVSVERSEAVEAQVLMQSLRLFTVTGTVLDVFTQRAFRNSLPSTELGR